MKKKEHIEEYQLCNDEALGVADGGQTVSEFLQEGTPLGIVAAVNTVMLTVASVFCGVCIASAMSGAAKSFAAWDFGGGAAGGGKKDDDDDDDKDKDKDKK